MVSRHDEIVRDGLIVIRPSSTVSWSDCNRRSAARAYPTLFKDLGYELRDTLSSAGAAVGTAVHAGAAYTLQAKVDTGQPGNASEADDRAITSFRQEIADGTQWDAETPRPNDGEIQVRRMVAEYRRTVAPRTAPVAVEQRLEADLGDGFLMSGQADTLAILPDAIMDLKTGSAERIHIPQLGSYSRLARAHGRLISVVGEEFIRRVKVSYAQPEAVQSLYPVEYAEQVSHRRIARIKADMMAFIQAGDANVLDTNPMSALCTPRYCSLYGTPGCRDHRGAFSGEN